VSSREHTRNSAASSPIGRSAMIGARSAASHGSVYFFSAARSLRSMRAVMSCLTLACAGMAGKETGRSDEGNPTTVTNLKCRFRLGPTAARCHNRCMRAPLFVVLSALMLASCARRGPAGFQGYLEGEFIYVAAPLAGQLEKLAVQKGARVEAGAPLFALERSAELADQRQAADQLQAVQARLADLKKGSRPT